MDWTCIEHRKKLHYKTCIDMDIRGKKEGGKAKGKLEMNSGKRKKLNWTQNMGRGRIAQERGAWKSDATGPRVQALFSTRTQ